MLKKWLFWTNVMLAGIILFVLCATTILFAIQPADLIEPSLSSTKRPLPKNPFQMSEEACGAIGKSCLNLQFVPLSLQLPDLRNHLIYYGKNGRPDAQIDHNVLHFAFAGNSTITSILDNRPAYILYDRTKSPPQYVFSPNNIPTPFWIETVSQGNDVTITVKMRGEGGLIISEPAAYRSFTLVEKENPQRPSGTAGKIIWEIGKWRVDNSLLLRQKAIWRGPDLFLERHGGEEFKEYLSKHRIDFNHEEESPYSVYVGLNDIVIWDGNQWKEAKANEESRKYPLMVVKKIDERIITFELWDLDGKNKALLNMVKSMEPPVMQSFERELQCLGARTRSQYIFEIQGQRFLLSPKDWLLKGEGGWDKLQSAEDIDAYVERKKTGLLFVFDGLVEKDGKSYLAGVLFNAARNQMQEIEIPIQKGGTSSNLLKEKKDKLLEEDENDDDDDSIIEEEDDE